MDTELGEDSSFMQGSTKLNFASQGLETSKSLYNERVISSIPTKNCLEISACTNSQAINTETNFTACETVTMYPFAASTINMEVRNEGEEKCSSISNLHKIDKKRSQDFGQYNVNLKRQT